ncbi:MAG: electron transfer flavoprotein subunit beta/FixA family protein [Saccharospirillaceae bacterium]|nr:electron transfer flavoprotein subunit beta/FixA family protein [Pseudomonadales bacterium]NRB79389.1 electron transfer flavoprotein subunit beta/FixA family protein [Saccharospirillaceae bacterium]
MKALVAIKRVLDYNVKARPNDQGDAVELANCKMSMNPFCEIAVEEAIRLKTKGAIDEVIVVSIGSAKCEEQIRSALALGADRGIHVQTDVDLSSLSVAKVLKQVAQNEGADIVLLGKQAIDSDNNQTGQMLAALMDCAQFTFASEVNIDGQNVEVTREVDTGSETLKGQVPVVITTDLRLNKPRFAKLPDIMKAKKKPLEKMTLSEFGVDESSTVSVLEVMAPAKRSAGVKVADVDELINKLKNEAKVIA